MYICVCMCVQFSVYNHTYVVATVFLHDRYMWYLLGTTCQRIYTIWLCTCTIRTRLACDCYQLVLLIVRA